MDMERVRGGDKCVRRSRPLVIAATLAMAVTPSAAQEAQPIAPPETPPAAATPASLDVSEYLTVDLHVHQEDLANVLQMLSIQSQRNIVMSSNVAATVSADLYDVTFYEALDAILNVNGYGYIERGNFLFVYTLDEIAQIEQVSRRPISRVITLDYLNANDAAEFVTPLLSEIGQIKANGDVGEFSIPDDAPVGDETFAATSTIVVFDYPEHVEEIERLVEELDTRPAQVLVEATILQTQLTEANAFGIDFSIIGEVDFTDFTNTGGPLSVANALQEGGTGASGEGFTPPDNDGRGVVSSPGNTGGPATFKLGVVNDDFSIFMRLLDEVTDFSVLSNPKLLVLNRQPARVLVGRRVGYLNTTSTETSTTQTVEFLDTGTQLRFRPFVSSDGFIRMELNPSVSEGVIRLATDVTGANVSIPDEITQELTTNVIVRDGSTIVLGGLFKETTTLSRRQVPVLGDIPLIGAAFRGHDDETDRSEIVFLITPKIVNDNVLLSEGKRAVGYVERVRAGSRQGLLPWSRERMTAMLNVEAERLALQGDVDKALWKVRRSLELNSNQPAAIRLREELLNEGAYWPSRSVLELILNEEYERAIESIEPVSDASGAAEPLSTDTAAEAALASLPIPDATADASPSPAPVAHAQDPDEFDMLPPAPLPAHTPVPAAAPQTQAADQHREASRSGRTRIRVVDSSWPEGLIASEFAGAEGLGDLAALPPGEAFEAGLNTPPATTADATGNEPAPLAAEPAIDTEVASAPDDPTANAADHATDAIAASDALDAFENAMALAAADAQQPGPGAAEPTAPAGFEQPQFAFTFAGAWRLVTGAFGVDPSSLPTDAADTAVTTVDPEED